MSFKNKKAEPILLLILTIAGGLLFWQSSLTKITAEEPLTARAYGMIISGIFLFTVITRLIAVLLKKETEGEEKVIKLNEPLLILIATIAMFIYTFGIIKLGYYISTFVYATFMIMMLRGKENRTLKNLLITAVGCVVFCAVLFVVFKTFKVYLPNAMFF